MDDINSCLKRQELAQRLGNDMELFRELADLFYSDSTEILARIREAIDGHDAESLRKNAHMLKGSVLNFSAERAYRSALALEMIGKDGDLSCAQDAYLGLVREIQSLREALSCIERERSL